MKTTIFFTVFYLLWINVMAQFPQAIKYQAIVRDGAGGINANKAVFFKISILSGSPTGTLVYKENHIDKITNAFGLVDIEIGKGASEVGTLPAIDWSSGSYFIKVEIFPTGATAWQEMGTTQLLSVPYALYAKDVQNKDDADADPTNEIQVISKTGNTVSLSKGGGSFIDVVDDADADPTNEIQVLGLAGNNLILSKGGGTVVIPGDNWGTQVAKTNATLTGQGTENNLLGVVNSEIQPDWSKVQNKPTGFADGIDNIDDADADPNNEIQVLSKSGNTVTLSKNGGSFVDEVNDADFSPTNEIQKLSITGTTLTLDNGGGSITLPSSGGGDNWGTDVVHSDVTLSGNGTTATPLKIAQQAATAGQVLKWDGAIWKPALDNVDDADNSPTNEIQALSLTGNNLSISGANTIVLPVPPGDDWGTQNVVSDITLAGSGTLATPLKIADNGVTTSKILDGTIATADLSDNSVTSAKIVDGTIVNADIANNAVNSSKIQDSSVGPADIEGNAITTAHIADNAITMAKLPSGAASDKYLRGDGTWAIPSGMTLPFEGSTKVLNAAFKITNSYSSGDAIGIYGAVTGLKKGIGVYGLDGSQLGVGIGVYGVAQSDSGYAVSGWAKSTYGPTVGVRGVSDSEGGTGVYGIASSTTGYNVGVLGYTKSNNGYSGYFVGGKFSILGNTGIGTITPAYKLDVAGAANLNSGVTSGVALRCNGADALWCNATYFSWGYGATYNYFANPVTIGTSATPSYELVVNGAAAKTGGGNWSNLSDARLKNLLGYYQRGLEDIVQLQPVIFTYKEGNCRELDPEKEQIGFVAQEVRKVFPEAVNEAKDGYLDFNMHPVNVAMVNAIKELKAENDSLKSVNRQQQSKIELLDFRLSKLESLLEATSNK